MKLNIQKDIAARVKGVSRKRIRLDESRIDEIKEAITKEDIKGLIDDKAIVVKQKKGVSRSRAKKHQLQKNRGRRRGQGNREGTQNARLNRKKVWMDKIRLQRSFLKELKEKGILSNQNYRMLYLKAKGGFFRSKRHIKLFINEQGLTNGK